MYFNGRGSKFFANNSLTECRSYHNETFVFLDHQVIFSLHTIYLNAPTIELTRMDLKDLAYPVHASRRSFMSSIVSLIGVHVFCV